MKIALVQLRALQRIEENLSRTIESMGEAARKGARLVCFPEVQFTPFFPQFPDRDASSYVFSINSPVIRAIKRKAAELKLVTIPNLLSLIHI